MHALLISTYELGRQPFGLASPAAFLRNEGIDVTCLDLSVQRLDENAVRRARLIAFYVPMHTATRIALAALDRVTAINPAAHICAYGLYAPMCADTLRAHGVHSVLGGEFEGQLATLASRLRGAQPLPEFRGRQVSLHRQQFLRPDRTGLPALDAYAHLVAADGSRRTVGYTEASRGCRHRCRHCPVVPVYQGAFRIVQADVVLADIEQQVAAGAQHITFGDPDFFNGPTHAEHIVRRLHERHPSLTYDVTIKVEHLLRHARLLPELRDTGCAFVTSAVESVDDEILRKLDKGHTAADFERVVRLFDKTGLALQPTFVAFTPWITLTGYERLLATIARLDLIANVPSIQLAIRLLIPAGSRLLELNEVRELVGAFDTAKLGYPWRHPDARVDALQRDVEALIGRAGEGADRHQVFATVWDRLQAATRRGAGSPIAAPAPSVPPGRPRATIPYLTEPWYC